MRRLLLVASLAIAALVCWPCAVQAQCPGGTCLNVEVTAEVVPAAKPADKAKKQAAVKVAVHRGQNARVALWRVWRWRR